MEKIILKIEKELRLAKARGLRFRELMVACRLKPREISKLREAVRRLEKEKKIIDCGERVYHRDFLEMQTAAVSRLAGRFGFVKLADGTEFFVPGRFFSSAIPGDSVLITPLVGRDRDNEAQIVKITKFGDQLFSGELCYDEEISPTGYYVSGDAAMKFPMAISKDRLNGAQIGDKVLCRLGKRGESHAEHRFDVLRCYGTAESASAGADAILDVNGISQSFPPEVQAEASEVGKKGVPAHEASKRMDLRDVAIFTIDGADTKDIDDAVSIKKLGKYYELSVHIADVSYYVKQSSLIEKEAFSRGTSIYFADRVIPMLPKELSNGVCSLNPDVDRLAFSCIMTINQNGNLESFDFKKTVIRSRVKGVYSEINAILANEASDEIKQKYSKVLSEIALMHELAEILIKNRASRGAPEIETTESKILLDENSHAIGIVPRTRGISECMIEEFMLLANESAATLAKEKELPFVYRVHEPPSEEKLEKLSRVLQALGLNSSNIKVGAPASVLSALLRDNKELKSYPVINTMVLRSMSKAKYFEEPLGHYGLVLENYAQFTSPIRRYPDLTIHRVLSEYANGTPAAKIQKMFKQYVVSSSRRSTETELAAMRLERLCDDCYMAEYMHDHIGEEYDAIISGLSQQGLFVKLENSVEGLLKISELPEGDYEFDDLIEYKENLSGKTYRIGDLIRVVCSAASASSGRIDFTLAKEE